MSTENPLNKLKPNGLSRVWSIYPWDKKNGSPEINIWFNVAKRVKTTSYLSKQIEMTVCKTCQLKGNGCTGVAIDSLYQVHAEVKSDRPLDRDGWRAKLLSLPCKPELLK